VPSSRWTETRWREIEVGLAVAVRVGSAVGVGIDVRLPRPFNPRHASSLHHRHPPDLGDHLVGAVGGDHERGAGARDLRDRVEELAARRAIEPLGGLVEQEHPRAGRERAGEEHAPPLARGEIQHRAPAEPLDPEPREHLGDAGRLRRRRVVLRPDAVGEAAEDDPLDAHVPVAPRVGVLLLGRHERDPLPRADGALRRRPREVVGAPAHRERPELAAEEPEERGLPRPVRSDERPDLPFAKREVHAGEQVSPGEPHVGPFDLDQHAHSVAGTLQCARP
jgi:hypothetical protein